MALTKSKNREAFICTTAPAMSDWANEERNVHPWYFCWKLWAKWHKAPKALALSTRPIEGSKKSRDFF